MIVAEGDNITSWDLELDAYDRLPTPAKKVEILPAVSHMSLYSEKADTNVAARLTLDWFAGHLAG
jgi:hypothetical protein